MMGKSARWWTRLLPLLLWIGIILWVASRPSTFFLYDKNIIFGMPRRLIQYPYHISAFFILDILLLRCFLSGSDGQVTQKFAILSLLGCVLVSICSELIQLFVPTRTPSVSDLALDLLGTVLGTSAMRHRYSPITSQPTRLS
jgi:VanZ like family